MSPPLLDRRVLRQQLIAAREALPEARRRQLTVVLAEFLTQLLGRLAPRTIGFCWPYRGEPDLVDFLVQWQTASPGRALALPVVPDMPGPLSFHAWEPGIPMHTDRFGIPAPAGSAPLVPDVLLVPVNGFDARGFRLGYGGGFFDRTLAACPIAPVTIGVGFELARLADVIPHKHDRPLDWIVTEAGIVVRTA